MDHPLSRIERLFKEREQKALRVLGAARTKHLRVQSDLERVCEMGQHYRTQLSDEGKDSIDSARLKHWQGFLGRLAQGEHHQREAVQRESENARSAEHGWHQARGKRKSIDIVIDKHAARAALRQQRSEQKADDEIAGRRPRK